MKKEFIMEGEIRPIKLIEKIEGLIVEIRSKTNSNFVALEGTKGSLFGYLPIDKKEIKPFEENIGILNKWIVLLEEILEIIKENSKIINFLNNELFRPEIENEYLKSERGGIIEHKGNMEEKARLNRQKIARRELIPSITLEKYLDEAIKRWRNEIGISKTKEEKLIAKCYIDAFQSIRVSILGELLPEEEK